MSEKTPQERLKEEQEYKDHVHHTKINAAARSEEHTSELQSLREISRMPSSA